MAPRRRSIKAEDVPNLPVPPPAVVPPDAADLARHALRVAIAEGRLEDAKAAAAAARADAEQLFARARRLGTQSLKVVLPDGHEVASMPILAGEVELVIDETALFMVAMGNDPGDIERFVHPIALADPDVIALIAEHFPKHTGRRIEATARQRYLTEFEENNGRVLDRTTGEREQVGEVCRHDPTGKFQYRKAAKDKTWLWIRDALDAGVITEDGEVVPGADLRERGETSGERVDEDAG
jgi:hypothetical protein